MLAPAELGAVAPHAVQDDRQLAGDRDPGAVHAPALGQGDAPALERTPGAGPLEENAKGMIAYCFINEFGKI